MRLFGVLVAGGIGAWLCALGPVSALADSYVIVESRWVYAEASNQTVGIYIANEVELHAMVLPIELRTVSGGAYIDGPFTFTITGRVGASGLEDFPSKFYMNTPSANTCSGPVSNTYGGLSGVPNADGSPDAFMYVGLRTTGPYLAPGADSPGDPSIIITFDASAMAGTFEIDTCCVAPSGHICFVDPDITEIVPSFTKGTVTIMACACDCMGDRLCDGEFNVLDVMMVAYVAFRAWPDISDPNPLCPVFVTDLDCDGDTDVLDVVRIANVAFRGGDPTVQFCACTL